MTEETTEMMYCDTSGCPISYFRVKGRDFKFPNDEHRYVRCPACEAMYRILEDENWGIKWYSMNKFLN